MSTTNHPPLTAAAHALHVPRTLPQPAIRKTDGWHHQLDSYHAVRDLQSRGWRGLLLPLGMGSGKSKVTVDLICNSPESDSVLILCPTSVRGVWRREFERHAGRQCEVLILDKGSVKQKTERAKKLLAFKTGNPRVVVINYESAWRPEFAAFSIGQRWDWIVCDESQWIKAHNSKVSKFCEQLAHRASNRLALTGTPMPHDPIDIFGQYRFLDPRVFGSSWHQFNHTYRTFKTLPGIPHPIPDKHQNMDMFGEKLARIMVQVPEYDLDLPAVSHDYRLCELGPKARAIYKGVRDDLIAEIDSGVVTAANAMVKVLRLQQVTSGYAKETESGEIEVIDDSKRLALEELLDSLPRDEPVCVYCYFQWDLDQVRFAAKTSGRRYGELSGRQHDLTPQAKMPENIDLLGVQVKSGGVGIDLTRSCYGVFYNTGTISPGDYDQILARQHRPGQTRPVRYYHLLCEHTVDVEIYKARQEKRDVVEAVMATVREQPTL